MSDAEREQVGRYPFDLEGTLDLGSGHALRRAEGGFLWWHEGCVDRSWCHVDTDSGQYHHVISGTFDAGDITIRASMLCPKGCGAHGFVTEGRWHV